MQKKLIISGKNIFPSKTAYDYSNVWQVQILVERFKVQKANYTPY